MNKCVPTMDLAKATHTIEELKQDLAQVEEVLNKQDERLEKLIEVVKLQQARISRNDELNTWLYYRGYNYPFSAAEGPGHRHDRPCLDGRKTDTYYPHFEIDQKWTFNYLK